MKVPKGTSDYQATWIVDDGENGEADEESSEEDDDDDDMLDEAMEGEDEDNMSQVNIWSILDDGASQRMELKTMTWEVRY